MAEPPELVPLRVFAASSYCGGRSHKRANWQQMSEGRLWRELCLCIISSRTRFEMALAAVNSLERVGLLRRLREEPEDISYSQVEAILKPPKHLRTPTNHSIPFWRLRARQLVEAAQRLYTNGNGGLMALLSGFGDPGELRGYLVSEIPGIGMKQASHFLQNVGFSSDFAVIDAHLLSFLRDELMVIDADDKNLSKALYVELEQRIQRLAAANGFDLGLLDHVVWAMKSR